MSYKATRCACGCGLPTGGGKYRPGHNTRDGRHWSKMDSRNDALRNNLVARRAKAYRLLGQGKHTRDFSARYFRLFHRVREVHIGTELECIVKVASGYRAVDVGIPELKLGWEYDPGHRYHLSTVSNSDRDKELADAGWRIIHCKEVPLREDIEVAVGEWISMQCCIQSESLRVD